MPKFLKWVFTLKGVCMVLAGRHFQFPLKFGPDFKRGIDQGLETKVFHI
jgi:hypothetical protein